MAYRKRIMLRLIDMGFDLTEDRQSANFILHYSIVSQPFILNESSSTYVHGSTSTITINKAGQEEEEIQLEQPGTYVPTIRQTQLFRKTFSISLFQTANDRLIWQAESVIENENRKHANYTNYLVYSTMRHFLKETQNHPQDEYYGRRSLTRIDELYQRYRFRR